MATSSGEARDCTDPCVQAARGERRECASSAAGAFQDALGGCLERDRTCVDACRTLRQDCRDATTLGRDLAACRLARIEARQRCRDELRLEIDVMPYAWVPGTYGSIAVQDTTVHLDVTPLDVLELLFDGNAFAGSAAIAASYGPFGLFADSTGGYMESRVTQDVPTPLCCTLRIDAKSKVKFAIADVGLGWEVGRWTLPARRRPLVIGVFAGARYVHFSNEVDAAAGVPGGAQRRANVFESVDWADPLIGVRWSAPLHEVVSLDFRGDIGGFHASSDLPWGLVGTVRAWLPWKPLSLSPYVALGYRLVAFDRSPDDGAVDVQMRGPVLGGGAVC